MQPNTATAPAATTTPAAADGGGGTGAVDGGTSTGQAPTTTTTTVATGTTAAAADQDSVDRVSRQRETSQAQSRQSLGAANSDDGGGDTGSGDGADGDGDKGKRRGKSQADSSDWKIDDLPPGAQKLIKELRDENGTRRNAEKTAAKKATEADDKFANAVSAFSKALGLTPDVADEQTPEQRLSEVTDLYRERSIELALYKGAAQHGGSPEALLDSRGFMTKAYALDPAKSTFDADVAAAIKEAVEQNEKLRLPAPVTPVEPATEKQAPSGGEFGGGPAGSGTREPTVDELRKARKKDRRADGYSA